MLSVFVPSRGAVAQSLDPAYLGQAQYRVPSGCPNRAQFIAEVVGRTSVHKRDWARKAAEEASVVIAVAGAIFKGSLRLGVGAQREMVGDTCEEIVQALALVTALHVEQHAVAGREGGVSLGEGAVEKSGAGQAAKGERAEEVEETKGDDAKGDVVANMAAGAGRTRVVRWAVGSGALAVVGPAPSTLFGGVLWTELASFGGISYSLSLGLEGAFSETVQRNATSSRFQWWVGRAMGCGSGLERRVHLWICATGAAGGVNAEGMQVEPIVDAKSVFQGWVSLGPALRVRFDIVGGLAAEASTGLDIPLIRHTTKFSAPDVLVHAMGPATGWISLGIGYSWPGSETRKAAISK